MDNHDQDDNSALGSALTDLMTSLTVIFILLLVVYLNHSYQEVYKGSASRRERILKELSLSNIKVKKDKTDPLSIIFEVKDNELQFDTDKDIIKPKGQAYLKSFFPKLTSSICSPKNINEIQALQIIGYTDSAGDDEHNLKLSQDRALSILKFGLNNANLNSAQRECLLNLSSINGRGERNLIPTKSRPGKENKFLSRRVEFQIRVKSYEQIKQLQEGALNKDK